MRMSAKAGTRRGRAMGSLFAACTAVLVVLGVPAMAPTSTTVGAATPFTSCTSSSQAARPLSLAVHGQMATGLYSLPGTPPRGIVVVGHGHTSDAASVAGTVRQIATTDDVVALAMDYRGTNLKTLFGWRVIEGAQDSIAATKMFDAFCPGSDAFTNSVLGISMGGNMSGLAVSSNATRGDGAPLYDYWFDVSGVTDVAEIYADAQAVSLAPIPALKATGTTAMAEMQAEFGGTPLTNPLAYLDNSPVVRTSEMRSSGLKGVVIAHGVVDGEVTSDMSTQMAAALAAAGIPTDVCTSVFKLPGTASGLTVDGYLSAVDPGYASPFAGHVSTVVLNSALSRLTALYQGGAPPNGTSVTLDDGVLGPHPVVTLPRL
jgi:hypothetical protein